MMNQRMRCEHVNGKILAAGKTHSEQRKRTGTGRSSCRLRKLCGADPVVAELKSARVRAGAAVR